MKKCLLVSFSFVALFSFDVLCAVSNVSSDQLSTEQVTENSDTDISSSNDKENKIKIDKEKALYWGLSDQEWKKFEKTMEIGGRGYWTPSLDPLTTLGIEANTDEERIHYAKLLVEKESQRVKKELAFQHAYDSMWKELHPNELPIELEDNPNLFAPIDYLGERLALFVSVNDEFIGASFVESILKVGKDVDIYLLDTDGDDNKIQSWAKKNNIPVDKVRLGNISLNHDAGEWKLISLGNIPSIMQKQNNKWRRVEVK